MNRRATHPHPQAQRIAAELRASPALLALTTRTLACDVIARYGVGYGMAVTAILLAKDETGRPG